MSFYITYVPKMGDVTMTAEQVQSMDLNELCEILDSKEVDYSSLENIEDIRDLVLQSVTDWNFSDFSSHSQEQVRYKLMSSCLLLCFGCLSSLALRSLTYSFTFSSLDRNTHKS